MNSTTEEAAVELYRRFRPNVLKSVYGQPEVVKTITNWIKEETIPHCVLFTGPSGTGKTTLAYILKKYLNIHDNDFFDMNTADDRGVDAIREIRGRMRLRGLNGNRAWLFDECHKFTNDAQNALLKIAESPPSHVYLFFATTEPNKLIPTLQSRCSILQLKAITNTSMRQMLDSILLKMQATLEQDVLDKIIDAAEGSARRAMVILKDVLALATAEEQLACIGRTDPRGPAINIWKALQFGKTEWPEMCRILKATSDEEPEAIRRLVLACCTNQLLKEGPVDKLKQRAYIIINSFRGDFFNSGKAGLAAACFEVIHGL